MENFVRKSKHFLLRSLLLIASLLILAVVVLQVGLLVSINALNTGKAHHYIQAQVTSALAKSGYNATFDKVFYDPVRGITIHNLTVLDKDGIIAAADKLSLDISFSKIPLRQLDMIIDAGEINVLRLGRALPEEEPMSSETTLQPFTSPDVYFKSFKIFRLNINKLNIGADIAGQPLSFSPVLEAELGMGHRLTVDAVLLPKPSARLGNFSLPEKIEVQGMVTPSTLSFAVGKFSILSPDYHLDGKGEGQLIENGPLHINIAAAYPDLGAITQDNFESANLTLDIDGFYNHPRMRINGAIIPLSLKHKGLNDIILSTTADNISGDTKGNIRVQSSYQKEPISLEAMLAYGDHNLTLESVKGIAPVLTLDGVGRFSMLNNLFDGKLSIAASDLSYYKDFLSMDMAGALKADFVLRPANELQALDVLATAMRIKFDTNSLGRADGELHFADINHLWPQSGHIQISDFALSDIISLRKVEAGIKAAGQDNYNLSLSGNGKMFSAVSFKGNMNVSDVAGNFPSFSDIRLTTTLGKSVVSVAGGLDAKAVDLKVSTKNFRGADIPAELPDTFARLRLDGDVVMSGPPASPSTKAHFIVSDIDTGRYKNLKVVMDANHQDGKGLFSFSGKGTGIKTLQAQTVFPVAFSIVPFAFDMDVKAPLSGDMSADFELGAMSSLILPPTQKFSGDLQAHAKLAGTLEGPDVQGALQIYNGQFTDEQNGITLRSMNVNSSFTKDAIVIQSIRATDGEKGQVNGKGRIDFIEERGTNLSLTLKKFHLPSSNLADGMLDATFSLANSGEGYILNGMIDIDHMNIIVPETFQSKIPELNIVKRGEEEGSSSFPGTLSLAIKVNAPNRIFVRGWGLDAEFGGEVDISGDATAPLFNGNLSSKRGRYEEFGKRFTLTRANLRFQGELPPSPYLDIEATTPANDVTAAILLAGPVAQPSITFSSTPVLPKDEVLSLLLFGRDTARITPFQAVQLAQTLRRFSGEGGGGGLNPLEMLRSATGLDDISVETDANGETNVGVGKYLTDKVYLEFQKGKAPTSGGANIQIELTPSINVQSEIGQDAQAGGGIFWKKDY